jgi:hypothetical protein
MNLLGIHLTLWIGHSVPRPVPPPLLEGLERAEVSHSDVGRSGFQLTFQVGRGGAASLLDYSLLSSPLLRPFNRVILMVTFNATPQVLMDGIITHQELSPSNEPGDSILAVTGEDISVMMDLEERSAEHPAQSENVIAEALMLRYAQYGLLPEVIPPPVIDQPLPTERTPVQQGTDLEYLQQMAGRFAYVFFVTPGPAPGTSRAYWGPPPRETVPQKALSVNLGPNSNVTSINFQHDALAPEFVEGEVQDRLTDQTLPVRTVASTRIPLASRPTWLEYGSKLRRGQFRRSGLSAAEALARAQATTDRSMDEVVIAQGELDALRYGAVLQPRKLVGLRGAGYSYDGLYYVKRVTHTLRKGAYTQDFTLTREGIGSVTPVVRP